MVFRGRFFWVCLRRFLRRSFWSRVCGLRVSMSRCVWWRRVSMGLWRVWVIFSGYLSLTLVQTQYPQDCFMATLSHHRFHSFSVFTTSPSSASTSPSSLSRTISFPYPLFWKLTTWRTSPYSQWTHWQLWSWDRVKGCPYCLTSCGLSSWVQSHSIGFCWIFRFGTLIADGWRISCLGIRRQPYSNPLEIA